MSIQWMTWVMGGVVGGDRVPALVGPTNGRRLVLLSIANHANEYGEAWPSRETVMAETALGHTAVDDAVGWLVDNGYMTKMLHGAPRKTAGSKRPNNFYVLTPGASSLENPKVPDSGTNDDLGFDRSRIPGSIGPGFRADRSRISGSKPSVEPSVEPSVRATGQPDPAFEAFWAAYPRREARARAEAAWKKLSAKNRAAATEAISAYVALCERESRPFMHATTWINGKRWLDETVVAEMNRPTKTARPQAAERTLTAAEESRARYDAAIADIGRKRYPTAEEDAHLWAIHQRELAEIESRNP